MAASDRTWWQAHDLTVRLANPAFLEAAIGCAFVLAAADGEASADEYDALLDRLVILGDVDRDVIDAHLEEAARQLEDDGFEPVVARATELLVDGPARAAAFRLALSVALADDDLSAPEREVALVLAARLGVADVDLDAELADVRGQ